MDKAVMEKWREQCEREDRQYAEEIAYAMHAVGETPPPPDVIKHPMVQDILRMLKEDQFLIQPAWMQIQELRAKVAEAKLRAVYTAEQYEDLKQRVLEAERTGAK